MALPDTDDFVLNRNLPGHNVGWHMGVRDSEGTLLVTHDNLRGYVAEHINDSDNIDSDYGITLSRSGTRLGIGVDTESANGVASKGYVRGEYVNDLTYENIDASNLTWSNNISVGPDQAYIAQNHNGHTLIWVHVPFADNHNHGYIKVTDSTDAYSIYKVKYADTYRGGDAVEFVCDIDPVYNSTGTEINEDSTTFQIEVNGSAAFSLGYGLKHDSDGSHISVDTDVIAAIDNTLTDATVSGDTLTITKGDGTTVDFSDSGGSFQNGYFNLFPDSPELERFPTTHDVGHSHFASGGTDIRWYYSQETAFDTDLPIGATIKVDFVSANPIATPNQEGYYSILSLENNTLDQLYTLNLEHIEGDDPLADRPNAEDTTNHYEFQFSYENRAAGRSFDGNRSGYVAQPEHRRDYEFLNGHGDFEEPKPWLKSEDETAADASGTESTAIGGGALAEATRSIALGYGAQISNTAHENSIVIGHGPAGDSDQLTIHGIDKIYTPQFRDSESSRVIQVDSDGQWALVPGGTIDATDFTAGNLIDITDETDGTVGIAVEYVEVNSTGLSNQASGSDAIVIGEGGQITTGDSAIAIGRNAQTGGNNSVVIGVGANTGTGNHLDAIAIGRATADATDAIAIGAGADAAGMQRSIALGVNARADTEGQLVVGATDSALSIRHIKTPHFRQGDNDPDGRVITVDQEGNWGLISTGGSHRSVYVEADNGDRSPLVYIKHNTNDTVQVHTVDSEYAGSSTGEVEAALYTSAGQLTLDAVGQNQPVPFDTDGTDVYVVTDTYTAIISGSPDNTGNDPVEDRTFFEWNTVTIVGKSDDHRGKTFAGHTLTSVHSGKLGFTLADTDWLTSSDRVGDGLEVNNKVIEVNSGTGLVIQGDDDQLRVDTNLLATHEYVQAAVRNATRSELGNRTSDNTLYLHDTEHNQLRIHQDHNILANRTRIRNNRGTTVYQGMALQETDLEVSTDGGTFNLANPHSNWEPVEYGVYRGNNYGNASDLLYNTYAFRYDGENTTHLYYGGSGNTNVTFYRDGHNSSSLYQVTARIQLLILDELSQSAQQSGPTLVTQSNEFEIDLPASGEVREVISAVEVPAVSESNGITIHPGQYVIWRWAIHIDHFDDDGVSNTSSPYLVWAGHPNGATHHAGQANVRTLTYELYLDPATGELKYGNNTHQPIETIHTIVDTDGYYTNEANPFFKVGGNGATSNPAVITASNSGAIAIGEGATVEGHNDAIALGRGATVDKIHQMRIAGIREILMDTDYASDSDYALVTKKYVDDNEAAEPYVDIGGAGADASATGTSAIAIGSGSIAEGDESIAIGEETGTEGDKAIAIGDGAAANNANAIAIGAGAATDSDNQLVIGAIEEDISISKIRTPHFGPDSGTRLITVDSFGTWGLTSATEGHVTADDDTITVRDSDTTTFVSVNTDQIATREYADGVAGNVEFHVEHVSTDGDNNRVITIDSDEKTFLLLDTDEMVQVPRADHVGENELDSAALESVVIENGDSGRVIFYFDDDLVTSFADTFIAQDGITQLMFGGGGISATNPGVLDVSGDPDGSELSVGQFVMHYNKAGKYSGSEPTNAANAPTSVTVLQQYSVLRVPTTSSIRSRQGIYFENQFDTEGLLYINVDTDVVDGVARHATDKGVLTISEVDGDTYDVRAVDTDVVDSVTLTGETLTVRAIDGDTETFTLQTNDEPYFSAATTAGASNADSGAAGSVAIGPNSETDASDSLAIGNGAHVMSGDVGSIAIGRNATTDTDSEVVFGGINRIRVPDTYAATADNHVLTRGDGDVRYPEKVHFADGYIGNATVQPNSQSVVIGSNSSSVGGGARHNILIGTFLNSNNHEANILIGGTLTSQADNEMRIGDIKNIVVHPGTDEVYAPDTDNSLVTRGWTENLIENELNNYQDTEFISIVPATATDAAAIAGQGSLSIGGNANAGYRAVALGNASADTDYSTAIGWRSGTYGGVPMGFRSTTIGAFSRAGGDNAVAFGVSAQADGSNSFALGRFANSDGSHSIAVGRGSEAEGTNAIAIGASADTANGDTDEAAQAHGDLAVALGSDARANNSRSIAIGYHSRTSGSATIAIGPATTTGTNVTSAAGNNSIAIGHYARTILQNSVAIGVGAIANGNASSAYGNDANAAGAGTVAVGVDSTAQNIDAIAIGNNATAQGDSSIGIGPGVSLSTTAQDSIAIGHDASATNSQAVAIGVDATASSASSSAFGDGAAASNSAATALGFSAAASGQRSISIGNSSASQTESVALGDGANANHTASVAIGPDVQTTQSNQVSFAGGLINSVKLPFVADQTALPTLTADDTGSMAYVVSLNGSVGRPVIFLNSTSGDLGNGAPPGWFAFDIV